MTRGWAIGKTAGAATVSVALLACPAMAQEEPEEDEPTRSSLSRVIFGSLEAGPSKTFVAVGVKSAVTGRLSSSGFRSLLKVGGAREQANRGKPHGTAYKVEAQSLLGYEWRIGETFVSLYAGSDVEGDQREKTGMTVVTSRVGGRIQADLWARPSPDQILQAGAYVSSLDRRVWARVATGWRLLKDIHSGPEIEIYREAGYSKLRFGLHLTGLRLFGLGWRISGGLQRTSDRPVDAYATLGLHWQR